VVVVGATIDAQLVAWVDVFVVGHLASDDTPTLSGVGSDLM
jgi:hypothetical protein